MKFEINPAIPISILMLFLGTISPSNSLDDGINKTPLELILIALLIVSSALFIYMTILMFDKKDNIKNK